MAFLLFLYLFLYLFLLAIQRFKPPLVPFIKESHYGSYSRGISY